MSKAQMLSQGNYATVIKPVAHKIGLEETLALMELVGLYPVKKQKHKEFLAMLKESGGTPNINRAVFSFEDDSFRCTQDEFEFETTLSRKKQDRVFKKLEELGLLKVLHKGLPSKRFIKLNEESISELVDKCYADYETYKEDFYKDRLDKREIEMEKRRERKKREEDAKVMKITPEPAIPSACPKGTNKEGQNGQASMDESDEQVCPKTPGLNNVLDNNVSFNNELDKNEFNSSSSNDSEDLGEDPFDFETNPKKEEEDKNFFFSILIDFLVSKGLSKGTIKKTIERVNAKGITTFTLKDLEDAYIKLEKHNAVEQVNNPDIFFANGLEKAIDSNSINKGYRQRMQQELEKAKAMGGGVPLYNWLVQD